MDLSAAKDIMQQLADFWFQTVFTALVLWFGAKYFDNKFFSKENIEKTREIHRQLDEQENNESKFKIKKIQTYLNQNSEELAKKKIDRVSIWINHNWMRNWKIHFIFYSLIAESSAPWLQKFTDWPIGSQKLPYYIFAEYEEAILEKGWSIFVSDQQKLWHTSKAIASDLGTKSLIVSPITNLKWKLDWMIFFSSVFQELKKAPEVEGIVNDICTIFIS